MKVLHYNTAKGWRGGEQQVLNLMVGLKEYPVIQFAAGQPGEPFVKAADAYADHVLPIKTRGELNLWAAVKMASFVRKYKIDIIHAHTANALSVALQARWFYPKVRVIAHRRVDFKIKNNFFSLYKYKTKRLNYIVAISKCIQNILIDQGIPKNKIVHIYSTVDPNRFQNVNRKIVDEIKTSFHISEDTFVLGNVAALSGHKDHKTLLQALPFLIEKGVKFQLFVLGEGSERAAIESLIESLNLSEYVHLMGFRDDVQNYLALFDLVVHSSNEEGLGTSIIDALAFGVPVLACAAGGIPEILGDDEFGMLTPVEDPKILAEKMLLFIEQPELLEKFKKAGKERAKAFSIPVMAKGMFDLYKTCMNS